MTRRDNGGLHQRCVIAYPEHRRSFPGLVSAPNAAVQPPAGWRDACPARGVTAEWGGCNGC